jgi:hypothetical protein
LEETHKDSHAAFFSKRKEEKLSTGGTVKELDTNFMNGV